MIYIRKIKTLYSKQKKKKKSGGSMECLYYKTRKSPILIL